MSNKKNSVSGTRQPVEPGSYRVLAINPGSTSIKLAIFAIAGQENQTATRCTESCEITHVVPAMRTRAEREKHVEKLATVVQEKLDEWHGGAVDVIAARGGLLPTGERKLSPGVYTIAERRGHGIAVADDIVAGSLHCPAGDHPANLAVPVAARLAVEFGIPAYCVDPPVVDELSPTAEVSGYAPIKRRSRAHALSVRAAAGRAAAELDRPAGELNLVVAHLGGGITVAAIRGGRMVDNTIALLGDGPFTPRRAGALPLEGLIDLCYSGRYTREDLIDELTHSGGLQSYLGEHRLQAIEERIAEGDSYARSIIEAMVYRIAKEIGAMFVAAGCGADAIVLTGGLTRSNLVSDGLRGHVEVLAPVIVFAGSLEMEALAEGAADALRGRANTLRYELPEGAPGV